MTPEPTSPMEDLLDGVVSRARLALTAVEAAHQAAADPQTPQAVRDRIAEALKASEAALEAAEAAPALRRNDSIRQRQSFAEFTTMLGEEVKEEADKAMQEGIQYAERTVRKAKSLVEDHFQIDEAFRMLGPLRQDSNRARDVHDMFNLVALLPVIFLNAANWSCLSFRCILVEKGLVFEDLWHGEVFWLFWIVTMAYFVVDLVFMIVLPQCVKSPGFIIKHHVATIAYLFVPFFKPDQGWLMGACMSVEINTWFLIARRTFNREGHKMFNPGVPPMKSLRIMCVSTCFYISWFVIRLIVYPSLCVPILQMVWKETYHKGRVFDITLICPPIQLVLMFMNVKWTIDLVRSKLKGRGAAKGL